MRAPLLASSRITEVIRDLTRISQMTAGLSSIRRRHTPAALGGIALQRADLNSLLLEHSGHCEPRSFTARLKHFVPLLGFVGAEVVEVSAGRTVLTAPLLQTAKNHNGTQQSSVFYLLADYALGIALFAAIPWVYVDELHDGVECVPVQMWLLGGQVKHLAPGTGEITAVASLGNELVDSVRQIFARKQRCRITGVVNIYQGDKLVAQAEHEVGMYAASLLRDRVRLS